MSCIIGAYSSAVNDGTVKEQPVTAIMRMTLSELAAETGASARQIRTMIQKGLVPHAEGNDIKGNYTYIHLNAVRKQLRVREEQQRLRRIAHNHRIIHVNATFVDEDTKTDDGITHQ